MPILMGSITQIELVLWRQATRRIITVLVLLAFGEIAIAAEPAAEIRTTVDRGLAFLAKDATSWKEERKCASCHHAPMALWSLNEAKKHGYTVDEKAVAELTAWVVAKDDPAKVFPNQPPRPEIVVNQSPLMLALGIEAGDVKEEATREGLAKMLSTVLEKQRADGSWGLLMEWEPIGSSPDVITSLALLSLASPSASDLGQPGKEAREKGLAWLAATKPGESLQGAAIKMLLWRRLGRPAAEWEPPLKQIMGRQNPDGGWSQTTDMASDAYATGQTLYALAEAGLPTDDPAVAKAQSFLVKSQESGGSWAMASRPGQPGGKSAKNLAPIVYAGTAWAVMGLVRSAPSAESPKVSGARRIPQVVPARSGPSLTRSLHQLVPENIVGYRS